MYLKILNLLINYIQIIFFQYCENNMKSNAKSKIIILIAVGILIALSPVIIINLILITGYNYKGSEYNNEINLNNKNLKISAVSGKIHIINKSGWVDFKNAGNCTGTGTYSDPYVIEDSVINGGGSGSCILIENSTVYFRIENCTLYNTDNTGIRLSNVNNSLIITNFCSSSRNGINLSGCNNNTISENIVNNNLYGIYLSGCNNNTISGNTANSNSFGIYLSNINNNTISGNTINLGSNGIDIFDSNYNTILGNILNNNDFRGIHLLFCDYNTISGNIVNNDWFGIYLEGDNNNITGNTLNYNHCGIYLRNSNDDTISGNIMNESGLDLSGNLEMLTSLIIDTTNLVNGKPLYYYLNEKDLGPNNFTSAGQVILVNCNDSLISNLDVSYCNKGIYLIYSNYNNISRNTANIGFYGIYLINSNYNNISGNTANLGAYGIYLLHSINNNIMGNIANNNSETGIYLSFSDYSTISGNTANNNKDTGIHLFCSDYNIVSGNILLGNDECIVETNCKGNKFSDNGSCTYGQADDIIPGYNLFFLLSILSVVAILISIKKKYVKKN